VLSAIFPKPFDDFGKIWYETSNQWLLKFEILKIHDDGCHLENQKSTPPTPLGRF